MQKKALWFFFTVTLQPFIMYQPSAPCFPSRNITKNAKAHPAPIRDEIIEQPLTSVWSVRSMPGISYYKITKWLYYKKKTFFIKQTVGNLKKISLDQDEVTISFDVLMFLSIRQWIKQQRNFGGISPCNQLKKRLYYSRRNSNN